MALITWCFALYGSAAPLQTDDRTEMAPEPECGGQRSVALPVENIRAPQDLLRPTSLPLRWTRTRTSGEGIGSDWGKALKNGHRVAKLAPWLRTARGRHRLHTLMYPEEGEAVLKAYLIQLGGLGSASPTLMG